MKTILIGLAMVLTACGSKGSSPASASATDPVAPVTPGTPVTPLTPPVIGSDPVLVVYTESQIKSVTTGGVTTNVTVTGSCAVYNAQTYCWDDGWHRPTPSMGFSYWGFVVSGGSLIQGSEGAMDIADPFQNTPTMMTASLVNRLPGNVINGDGSESTMVTRLLAAGTPASISCMVDVQSLLDCGSFTLVP